MCGIRCRVNQLCGVRGASIWRNLAGEDAERGAVVCGGGEVRRNDGGKCLTVTGEVPRNDKTRESGRPGGSALSRHPCQQRDCFAWRTQAESGCRGAKADFYRPGWRREDLESIFVRPVIAYCQYEVPVLSGNPS